MYVKRLVAKLNIEISYMFHQIGSTVNFFPQYGVDRSEYGISKAENLYSESLVSWLMPAA